MTSRVHAPTKARRVEFQPAGAYTFCHLDFTGIQDSDEALREITEARHTIAETPPGSLRVLTDVTGSRMTLVVIAALQELARANTPHVQRSAIIGLSVVHRVALRQIVRLTGREIREFETRDAAMEYLRG